MKSLFGLLFAGLILVCLLNGCNAEPPKIAVVDLSRVVNESQEGKRANETLDALVKEKREDAAAKAQMIEKLKKDLEKEPAATRKSKEDDLVRIAGEYQKKVAASETEVRNKAAELKAGLLKEIRNILDSIGAEEKYLVILTAESAPYFQKTIDITDKVILRYNELQGSK